MDSACLCVLKPIYRDPFNRELTVGGQLNRTRGFVPRSIVQPDSLNPSSINKPDLDLLARAVSPIKIEHIQENSFASNPTPT